MGEMELKIFSPQGKANMTQMWGERFVLLLIDGLETGLDKLSMQNLSGSFIDVQSGGLVVEILTKHL